MPVQLQAAERLFLSLSDPVVVADREGTVVASNPAARRLAADWGLDPVRVDDFPWSGVVALDRVQGVLDGDEPEVFRTSIRHRARAFEVVVHPVGGEAGGGLLHMQDVTRRSAAEAEVARLRRLQQLGILLGGLAHDLQNVFGAASGFAQLVQEGRAEDRQDQQRVLDNLRRATEEGSRWMRRLLDLVGTTALRRAPEVSIGSLVDDACALLRKSLLEMRTAEKTGDFELGVRAEEAEAIQLLVGIVSRLVRDATGGAPLCFDVRKVAGRPRPELVLTVYVHEAAVPEDVRVLAGNQIREGVGVVRTGTVGLVEALLMHRLDGGDLRVGRFDAQEVVEIVFTPA